jgi:hypothetical protein
VRSGIATGYIRVLFQKWMQLALLLGHMWMSFILTMIITGHLKPCTLAPCNWVVEELYELSNFREQAHLHDETDDDV